MNFLSKKQLTIFLIIAFIITAPFLLLHLLSPISGASAMIFLVHFMAGLPWVLLYLVLPFDIPGFTSAGDSSTISFLFIILMYLPIYINLIVILKFTSYILKKPINKKQDEHS